MATRYRILPARGTLLVSTDVHGNGEDFRRMREIFEGELAENPDTYWVILGDIVHAPNDSARARQPELYDYDDESAAIAEEIRELTSAHPERVFFVLGNHDWAHIGGPPVRKFYDDEAEHLESTLTDEEIQTMREVFEDALLCVLTPCGAFLSHASPGAILNSLDELDDIDLGGELAERQAGLVRTMTNYYGQKGAVSRSFLRHTSEISELHLTFVVHGHDRDEAGWFAHEDTQLCVVIFGAPRENKRYLRLDLSAHYGSVEAIEEDTHVLRLWGDS